MVKEFKHLNQMPIPTWSWLQINSASLEMGQKEWKGYEKEAVLTFPGEVQITTAFAPVEAGKIPLSLRQNYEFVTEYKNNTLQIILPEGKVQETPVVIDYNLDSGNSHLVDYIHIKAGKDSSATVVIRYGGDGSGGLFHFGFTLIEAEENANVKVIKAQLLPQDAAHVDAVSSHSGEGAQTEILLAELGSGKSITSCNLLLDANRSTGRIDGIYLGKNQKDLDMNYRIEFAGKETEGNITVKGALAGAAKKTLRSTIDFIRGASGSKGSEDETVLTLSDKVINRSAPLLLCGEDDVEGSHATSTGRPDPGKLYYLLSRGFDEKEARRLLVEASFAPVLKKVEPEPIKQEILEYIGAIVHGE